MIAVIGGAPGGAQVAGKPDDRATSFAERSEAALLSHSRDLVGIAEEKCMRRMAHSAAQRVGFARAWVMADMPVRPTVEASEMTEGVALPFRGRLSRRSRAAVSLLDLVVHGVVGGVSWEDPGILILG
jgi:hypothetical protein